MQYINIENNYLADCNLSLIMFFHIYRTLTESVVDLQYHQRRVGLVLWHPTALNILLTAGMPNLSLR